jgi:hypothetical protein
MIIFFKADILYVSHFSKEIENNVTAVIFDVYRHLLVVVSENNLMLFGFTVHFYGTILAENHCCLEQ